MTVSLNLRLDLGNVFGGQRTGAVVVTPDRLLTFSQAPISGPQQSVLVPGGSGALAPRYIFRINPSKLAVSHEKLDRFPLTKAGYEIQAWGNGLSMFRYSGSAGVFRPEANASFLSSLGSSFDIRQTFAWQRFKEFETFYRTTGSQNLFMYCVDYPHDWEGKLGDFSMERDAERPFTISYSFKFTGLPKLYPTTTVNIAVPGQSADAAQAALASQSAALVNSRR